MHLMRCQDKLWNRTWLQFVFLVCSLSKVICDTAVVVKNASSAATFTKREPTDEIFSAADIQSATRNARNVTFTANSSSHIWSFPWDKISMSARRYQIDYCARVCYEETIVSVAIPGKCSSLECFPCDCNKPLCQYYGTCCPDYRNVFPTKSSKQKTLSNSSGIQRALASSKMATFRHSRTHKSAGINLTCDKSDSSSFLSIKSCPTNYSGSHVRSSCENDIPIEEQDLGMFLRVTNKVTGVTYFNQHCATCNAITDFEHWNMEVTCSNSMKVYRASTIDDIFKMSSSDDFNCRFTQRAPSNLPLYKCDSNWFSTTIIGTCNVTGQWDVYDEDVERACEEMTGITSRVRNIHRCREIYKNLFCGLCNANTYPIRYKSCPVGAICPSLIDLPFTVLLNFAYHEHLPNSEQIFTNCSHDAEWASSNNLCLPLLCAPGKVLTNGVCSAAISEIRGLSYKIQITYLLKVSTQMAHSNDVAKLNHLYTLDSYKEYFNRFRIKVENIMSKVAKETDINKTMMYTFQNLENPMEGTLQYLQMDIYNIIQNIRFLLDGFLLSEGSRSRDKVETFLVEELLTKAINFSIDHNSTLTLIPMLVPDRRDTHFNCQSNTNEKLMCMPALPNRRKMGYSKIDKQNAIFVDPQLTCPFLSFNATHYFYESNSSSFPNNSLTLYVDDVSVIVSEISQLNMLSISEDRTLKVCKELLTAKFNSFERASVTENTLMFLLLDIFTSVCMGASILCLALTLLTYSLFPALRNEAGKNNMFLCGSLLLAQCFLLAASHIPKNNNLCTFFAISTHFLWLSMFCWCFTSCLHMFRTFTAKTRVVQTTTSAEKKYIIKRVVACTVVPALIVIAVFVTNYFTSQGRRIGYGRTTCFLDSPTLVGTTLVAPLCLVLICNVYFFTATISKIHNIRKLQTGDFKKDDRKNLYIYVKLSSVTGMFWILAIISEATNNDPLRFIAIFLNGLEGVFIFLSYICNKRVLRLYMQAIVSQTNTSKSRQSS